MMSPNCRLNICWTTPTVRQIRSEQKPHAKGLQPSATAQGWSTLNLG